MSVVTPSSLLATDTSKQDQVDRVGSTGEGVLLSFELSPPRAEMTGNHHPSRRRRTVSTVTKPQRESSYPTFFLSNIPRKVVLVASGILWLSLGIVNATDIIQRKDIQHDDSAFTTRPLTSNHSLRRDQRFPSIQERIKLYMGHWYAPPCRNSSDDGIVYKSTLTIADDTNEQIWTAKEPTGRHLNFSSHVAMETIFALHPTRIIECSLQSINPNNRTKVDNSRMYCQDVVHTLLPAMDNVQLPMDMDTRRRAKTSDEFLLPPILLQFGDTRTSSKHGIVELPVLKKFRRAMSMDQLRQASSPTCVPSLLRRRIALLDGNDSLNNNASILQPIIWKLASSRHFGKRLKETLMKDIPWEQKRKKALFVGILTGFSPTAKFIQDDLERCLQYPRCQFVWNNANSTLVDARLTSTKGRVPDVIRGVSLTTRDKIPIRDQLQYKALVMLEGNDVSSGLKWALLSRSVVIMPPPTFTSWAMEELLQPWVHYIPLNMSNPRDADEKMDWIIANDDKAQRIAQRGSLWMQDLVFHPDAPSDDNTIQDDILRRYMAHFSVHNE